MFLKQALGIAAVLAAKVVSDDDALLRHPAGEEEGVMSDAELELWREGAQHLLESLRADVAPGADDIGEDVDGEGLCHSSFATMRGRPEPLWPGEGSYFSAFVTRGIG